MNSSTPNIRKSLTAFHKEDMPDTWWNYPIERKVLLKNGNVVNSNSNVVADVLINEGVIKAVARNISPEEDALVLDVSNMFVMPGGIDPNTHFDAEFMGTKSIENFYNGTRAAVAGGTTMIIDFAVPKIGESLDEAYRRWRRKADSDVVCDYGLHMEITWWDEEIEREMGQIVVSCGINSFKMNMAFKDTYMLSDSEIYQALLRCKNLGALGMVHAENGDIISENVRQLFANGIRGPEGHYLSRSPEIEAEAIFRVCTIANEIRCPLYICNLMSEQAADCIESKRFEANEIFGETIAAALGSTGAPREASFRVAAAHITAPPINRNPRNPLALMRHLANGTLCTVGSNNCTFAVDQKAMGKRNFIKIPLGVNGVEDRMSVVWEKGVNAGILTPSQFVAVTSTNSAKLFNLYPKKGAIAVGSDADVVVWNPTIKRRISYHSHKQASDYNVFQGMTVEGAPQYVFVRGNLCVESNILKISRGYGNYIHTQSYSEMAYPRGSGRLSKFQKLRQS